MVLSIDADQTIRFGGISYDQGSKETPTVLTDKVCGNFANRLSQGGT